VHSVHAVYLDIHMILTIQGDYFHKPYRPVISYNRKALSLWDWKWIFIHLHEIRKRKANWIGHILRRNCLLKEVIEGKIKGRIEVTRRRGRRRKKLLDDLGDRRGYSDLKEEALDRIKWRNRFGRGCGPVVCLTDYWWMNVARMNR
jgi:hypothetical protein